MNTKDKIAEGLGANHRGVDPAQGGYFGALNLAGNLPTPRPKNNPLTTEEQALRALLLASKQPRPVQEHGSVDEAALDAFYHGQAAVQEALTVDVVLALLDHIERAEADRAERCLKESP